jgi:hypothetical protein
MESQELEVYRLTELKKPNKIRYDYNNSGVCSGEPAVMRIPSVSDYAFYKTFNGTPLFVGYSKVTTHAEALTTQAVAPDYTEHYFEPPSSSNITTETKYNSGSVSYMPASHDLIAACNGSNPAYYYIFGSSYNSIGYLITYNNAKVGRPLSTKYFNGRGDLSKEETFEYFDEPPQGIITQASNLMEAVRTHYQDEINTGQLNFSHESVTRIINTVTKYVPSVLKAAYSKEKGIVKKVENVGFDFLTGQVSNVATSFYPDGSFNTDGSVKNANDIKKILTVDNYAYTSRLSSNAILYPLMGSKFVNPLNKNLLTLKFFSGTYDVDPSGNQKPLSFNVNTWKNTWVFRNYNSGTNSYIDQSITDSWKLSKAFKWKSLTNSDGSFTYPNLGTFPDQFQTGTPSSANWVKEIENTRYNNYTHAIESSDINSNNVAVKFGYNDRFSIAKATNSNYFEVAYSGAEDVQSNGYSGGEVLCYNSFLTPTYSHTGKYCIKLDPGNFGFTYRTGIGVTSSGLLKGRKYKTSVWVHSTGANNAQLYCKLMLGSNMVTTTTANVSSASTKIVGTWYLVSLDIDIPNNATVDNIEVAVWNPGGSNSSTTYVDDFRVHPVGSDMNSYVYDNKTGWLLATLDQENLAIKYFYDNSGRVYRTYKETLQGFKKVSETTYNFGKK